MLFIFYFTSSVLVPGPSFVARDRLHSYVPVIVAVVVAQFFGKFCCPTAD